jgi:hypothetical protein
LIIDTVNIWTSCLMTVYPAALCGYPLTEEFFRMKWRPRGELNP